MPSILFKKVDVHIVVSGWCFVNHLWLDLIAYHTQIGLGTIAISILVQLFFVARTVGSQTLRATHINPVDNLKKRVRGLLVRTCLVDRKRMAEPVHA